MLSGNIKYVIRLRLPRLLSKITIGSNFLSKCIFVSEYFKAERCCEILELESVKKFRSESGVEKLATPQRSNSKAFLISSEGNFSLVSQGLSACW